MFGDKMVTEHKKYVMRERAKADKKQSIFGTKEAIQLKKAFMITKIEGIDVMQRVMCPFCLYADKLQHFLRSTSKGVSYSLATCPECKNGMRMTSLTADWTPEQYADWVSEYMLSGFFQKCKFATWSKRLKEIGWATRFWKRYHDLKGTEKIESYTDYMERKAQEDAQEQYNKYVDDHE